MHDIRLQELRLYTDFGRCCRPLFIVDRQALRIKKSHIRMLQGLVEEQKLVWQARPRPGRPRAPPPPRRPRSSRLLLICLTACALLNPRHSGSSAAPSSVRRVPFTARPGTPARGRARPGAARGEVDARRRRRRGWGATDAARRAGPGVPRLHRVCGHGGGGDDDDRDGAARPALGRRGPPRLLAHVRVPLPYDHTLYQAPAWSCWEPTGY